MGLAVFGYANKKRPSESVFFFSFFSVYNRDISAATITILLIVAILNRQRGLFDSLLQCNFLAFPLFASITRISSRKNFHGFDHS